MPTNETAVSTQSQVETGANRLRELHEKIHRTLPKRDEEWREACAEFHRSYDGLAFPGGLERAMQELKLGDAYVAELAVTFLEVDAMLFRSGYIKEELIQQLKKAELSNAHCERLSRTILNVVDSRDCREFRRYCQLASRVHTKTLVAELQTRKATGEDGVVRRANWVLDAIESSKSNLGRSNSE